MRTVEIEQELDGIVAFRVPGWPGQCQVWVEARTDDSAAMRIIAPQRYEGESYKVIRLREGILCLVSVSTQGRPQRLIEDTADLTLVVQLPADKMNIIAVER